MAKILLVDDNSKIRIITRMMLEKTGHEVLEASSGEEGLKMLEKDTPDLILLDIMMPGMDGWEVCQKIKADEKYRDIPLVMLTVRASEEDMDKSMEYGADAHVNKPFDMEYLLDTVERQLKNRTQ
jgi:CheY-like chemotaxis protein